MSLLLHIFSGIVAFSMMASPATALTATSSATATTNTMKSSGNTGAIVAASVVGGTALLFGSQLLSAVTPHFTSFGGRVVAIVPCSGGMLHVTIIPAGLFPVTYIWTPFTATKLYGPPIHPGQQLVGLADIPFVCFVGVGLFTTPVPLYGLRMTTVGTSI
jgi:hypothetical protein